MTLSSIQELTGFSGIFFDQVSNSKPGLALCLLLLGLYMPGIICAICTLLVAPSELDSMILRGLCDARD